VYERVWQVPKDKFVEVWNMAVSTGGGRRADQGVGRWLGTALVSHVPCSVAKKRRRRVEAPSSKEPRGGARDKQCLPS
jgi:hypothetical protein